MNHLEEEVIVKISYLLFAIEEGVLEVKVCNMAKERLVNKVFHSVGEASTWISMNCPNVVQVESGNKDLVVRILGHLCGEY